jgi:hypothetical protein
MQVVVLVAQTSYMIAPRHIDNPQGFEYLFSTWHQATLATLLSQLPLRGQQVRNEKAVVLNS